MFTCPFREKGVWCVIPHYHLTHSHTCGLGIWKILTAQRTSVSVCNHDQAYTCESSIWMPCGCWQTRLLEAWLSVRIGFTVWDSLSVPCLAGNFEDVCYPGSHARNHTAIHSLVILFAECKDAVNFQGVVMPILYAVTPLSALFVIFWAAKVRSDMRKKLNIPGTASCQFPISDLPFDYDRWSRDAVAIHVHVIDPESMNPLPAHQ